MGDWIRLLVKYRGKCAECGKEIPAGDYALWSRTAKTIKHMKCESGHEIRPKMEVRELYCFVCHKPAGCADCGFEADCDRDAVSQACICNQCLEDKDAFAKYQQSFIELVRKVAKVKI